MMDQMPALDVYNRGLSANIVIEAFQEVQQISRALGTRLP
jgi:hypothetical protein